MTESMLSRADDVIVKSRHIDAPRTRVFQLLSDPDQVELWFAHVVTIERRLGGAVEFLFYNRSGTASIFQGEITAYAPSSEFGFTWHNAAWGFPPLSVRFTLEPAGGDTGLHLTHSGFSGQPIERDIHDEGWEHYLERLAAVADGSRPEGWNYEQ